VLTEIGYTPGEIAALFSPAGSDSGA